MKTFLYLFFLLPFSLFAQTKPVTYTETVVLDSAYSEAQLYSNAKVWFAKEANLYNNQIKNKRNWELKPGLTLDNKDAGELMGTNRLYVTDREHSFIFSYDAYLYLKQGKYKYVFTNIKYLGTGAFNRISKSFENKSTAIETMNKKRTLMAAFDSEMHRAIGELKKDMARRKEDF